MKQHLTIKNFFLALVALNILSAVSTTQMVGGTFEHVSRPSPPMVRHSDGRTVLPDFPNEITRAARALEDATAATDRALIAHMFPGEALLPGDVPPARAESPAPPVDALPPRDEMGKPVPKPAPAKKPRVSDPPSVSWLMLLSVAAMALYARYVAAKMAQTAISHALDSVKQIAGALSAFGAGVRAPAKPTLVSQGKPAPYQPTMSARQPITPTSKTQPQKPRTGTVVKPSRWPFFA